MDIVTDDKFVKEVKKMKMTFNMPVRVYYGNGCIQEHADEFGKLGKKAIIITDHISFTATGADKDIRQALEKQKIEYRIYEGVESNPTIENVRKAAGEAKAFKADFVVSVGGGSSLDTAKAAAPDRMRRMKNFSEQSLLRMCFRLSQFLQLPVPVRRLRPIR